jgi:hypothetical protein
MNRLTAATLVLLPAILLAEATTRPADPVMDELMSLTTQPSTPTTDPPATQPAALVNKSRRDGARQAILTLSDGKVVKGALTTTPDRPIRLWDDSIKDYRDIPFHLIKSASAKVLWERDEPEWTFRESGSDVKIFTGKTYPARETVYVVTLINDQQFTGGVVAPLYYGSDNDSHTYVLHKRAKGDVGQKLAELVYVKRVEFE